MCTLLGLWGSCRGIARCPCCAPPRQTLRAAQLRSLRVKSMQLHDSRYVTHHTSPTHGRLRYSTLLFLLCHIFRRFLKAHCLGFLAGIINVKSSSRYRPVHFLPTTFADRGPKPRKQRPIETLYFGDNMRQRRLHAPEKIHGFAPQRVFSSLNSRVPKLLHFPSTLDDW